MFTVELQHLIIAPLVIILAFFVKLLIKTVRDFKANREHIKAFKAKEAEVEKFKEEGNHHEWIPMPIGTETHHVCKKTGWCPSGGGFVPMGVIQIHLERLKIEEEFQAYRKEKIDELSQEYNMNAEEVDNFAEKVFDIKKQFHVQLMEKAMAEMRKGAESGN